MLEYVPDWFFTEDMVTEGTKDVLSSYHFRKKQKANIREELLPVAWHPNRYWDWCLDEDEKYEISKLWSPDSCPASKIFIINAKVWSDPG